jgi:hypothetical protein
MMLHIMYSFCSTVAPSRPDGTSGDEPEAGGLLRGYCADELWPACKPEGCKEEDGQARRGPALSRRCQSEWMWISANEGREETDGGARQGVERVANIFATCEYYSHPRIFLSLVYSFLAIFIRVQILASATTNI